jgi:hypothetical protein
MDRSVTRTSSTAGTFSTLPTLAANSSVAPDSWNFFSRSTESTSDRAAKVYPLASRHSKKASSTSRCESVEICPPRP